MLMSLANTVAPWAESHISQNATEYNYMVVITENKYS